MVNHGLESINASALAALETDAFVWAAGYESRSRWLVTSSFAPRVSEDALFRIEFVEDRDVLSAQVSLRLELGRLLGGTPEMRGYDKSWRDRWRVLALDLAERKGRPVSICVDISSMPRTVYGALLVEAFTRSVASIEDIVLVYVPGRHATSVDGHRQLDGFRALVGLEGSMSSSGPPGLVLGLGYDGALAEAVVEAFSTPHITAFWAEPSSSPEAVRRAQAANDALICSVPRAIAVPLDVTAAVPAVLRLIDWHAQHGDVIVVPLGPKPHVIAAIVATLVDPRAGLRCPSASATRPLDVTVDPGAQPVAVRVRPAAQLAATQWVRPRHSAPAIPDV